MTLSQIRGIRAGPVGGVGVGLVVVIAHGLLLTLPGPKAGDIPNLRRVWPCWCAGSCACKFWNVAGNLGMQSTRNSDAERMPQMIESEGERERS